MDSWAVLNMGRMIIGAYPKAMCVRLCFPVASRPLSFFFFSRPWEIVESSSVGRLLPGNLNKDSLRR